MPIIKSYYKVLRATPDPDYFYVKNETSNSINVTLNRWGTVRSTDLEYSKDKSTWTSVDLTQSSTVITLSNGEKVFFRSSTGFSDFTPNSRCFNITANGNFSAGGDLKNLIDYTADSFQTIPDGSFGGLFIQSTYLISVDDLKITGIAALPPECFGHTFDGTSITTGMDLSNITSLSNSTPLSGSLENMYNNASKLEKVTAPNVSNWYYIYAYNWLSGAGSSATGTKIVYCPAGVTIDQDTPSGIPTGWTRVDY